MREKLKRAAASSKTLHGSIWLSTLAAVVATLAANWPLVRGELDWRWWLIGLVMIGAANIALHRYQTREKAS